jgi:hypothetical protein
VYLLFHQNLILKSSFSAGILWLTEFGYMMLSVWKNAGSAARLGMRALFFLMFSTWSLHGSLPQYYAQVYTEILGRAPSPQDWTANEYRFHDGSSNINNVRQFVSSLFQSAEFNNLGYNPTEKAYVLYRSIFLREPSTEELASLASQLTSNSRVAAIVSEFLNSTEFTNLFNQRIVPSHSHGFLDPGPDERPAIGSEGLGNITGAELQSQLDLADSGDVVYLAQGALVRLNNQLVIPEGVTLATYDAGAPDNIFVNRQAYASMGRLARARMFNEPLVLLMPGARLIGVWVDGRRSQLRVNDPTLNNPSLSPQERFQFSHNISVRGGSSLAHRTEVAFCKLSDSTGWTSLHNVGENGGLAIGFSRVANNTITSYSASRDVRQSFFTDGISNASSDAEIINNEIVDPSDVGVVSFNPGFLSPQRSQILNNQILFAGNDGWGGITLDHSVLLNDFCRGVNENAVFDCLDPTNDGVTASFIHALVRNNLIWSSDSAHTNVGISLGVHAWGLRMFGLGGQVLANQLGTSQQPLRVGVGIMVAGIREPVVLENQLHLQLDQSRISCLSTELLADPLSTTLGPDAALQNGFVFGETWATLRPKSNGYVFGDHNLQPSDSQSLALQFETQSASLRVADVNENQVSDNWVIVRSERDYGDGNTYYVIANKGNQQVIQSVGNSPSVSTYLGMASQLWRVEPFDNSLVGNGIRFVNMESGLFLARDNNGVVFLSDDLTSAASNWRIKKNETRPLDPTQSDLLFMDPYGQVFQVYTDSAKIEDDRVLGNPGAQRAFALFAGAESALKPLGTLDYNADGWTDAAYITEDGAIFINFLTRNGYTAGGVVGNMRNAWTWDIANTPQSWEKPLGFIDVNGDGAEDLVAVDLEGNLEVGFMTADGLQGYADLGAAASLGLDGLTSSTASGFKSVGSGDFDGDAVRELLVVAPAGGLYSISANGGSLESAVALGNPRDQLGWGFTSAIDSAMKPVAITDVNQDQVDDVVMVAPDGRLLAYLMENGRVVRGVELGNPQSSWNWNLNANSQYSLPISIPYGTGWWAW